jgi:hypothetical protein
MRVSDAPAPRQAISGKTSFDSDTDPDSDTE